MKMANLSGVSMREDVAITVNYKTMDVHGLTHLKNILYREDELKDRTKLVFKWVKEKELTQKEFDTLVSYCNEESVKRDKARRYGQ